MISIVFNPYISQKQLARTIKAQYQKIRMANFVRRDGLGATAIMEII
jgi:hypothetical protein